MKPSEKKFMEDIRKELKSFENIPKNYKKKHTTVSSSSSQKIVELNEQYVKHTPIIKNRSKISSKIDPAISTLQEINTTGNIDEIDKLHHKLFTIETNNNVNVAKKYLSGFLEERGVNSLKEFINSILNKK
jgi:3-methyladenine DNA glycosylase Tag